MAQTATQLLRKEVSRLGTRSRFYYDVMELIDKAEKIEKEQMIYFGNQCQMVQNVSDGDEATFLCTSEELFEETFKK